MQHQGLLTGIVTVEQALQVLISMQPGGPSASMMGAGGMPPAGMPGQLN